MAARVALRFCAAERFFADLSASPLGLPYLLRHAAFRSCKVYRHMGAAEL